MEYLKKRFYILWKKINAKIDAKKPYYLIKKSYDQKHRRYHSLSHIEYCLKKFSQYRKYADDPTAIEMAIFFHDIIWDPTKNNNEKKSAELAEKILKKAKVKKKIISKIKRLIMATTHKNYVNDIDSRLIADIDLISLAKPIKQYFQDMKDVRWELSIAGKKILFKRKKFLRSMIDRKRIYQTKDISNKYEKKARQNILKELNNP